jgi:hypothetical protein
MKKLPFITRTVGAVATAALGLAGPATAAPTGSESAADVVASLQAQSYAAQINGTADQPLSQCKVTGLPGLPLSEPGRATALQFTTVYVDITCANES